MELDIHDYQNREKAEGLLHEFIQTIRNSDDQALKDSVKFLLEWTPESCPIQFTAEHNPYYNIKGFGGEDIQATLDEDSTAPFFSEAYLYNLLGKEDARTLLAMMRPIWLLAGIERIDQP